MAVEEMLSMHDTMGQCWHAFLQPLPASEGEALDLTATQAMDLDPPPDSLRRSPHGEQLHDLTEAEESWVREERQ
eukprot:11117436-Alexandrium_andersonii.AAC.1